MQTPTTMQIARSLLAPMSVQHALDPFAVKAFPKHSIRRLSWTARSRLLEKQARRRPWKVEDSLDPGAGVVTILERGGALPDTAVTSGQLALLERGLEAVAGAPGDIAEIGCFRGVTTIAIARRTRKRVYAVDPFIGYGGSEAEYTAFTRRIADLPNIQHLRRPSGEAAASVAGGSLSFVFIDAIHDVSNSWFDFVAWSPKVAPGGLIAMHDVDDFPGTGYTMGRILRGDLPYRLWGYTPNMAVVEKLGG